MTDSAPSFLDICEETLGIFTGLVTALLPFLLLSAPAIIPLAVFGGVVAAALALVAGVVGAIIAVPLLLIRLVAKRVR
jgi:hypothetical protein